MSNLRDTSQPTKSIREEIHDLATTLADTAQRLNRLVDRLDQREENSTDWRDRYEDLERSHNDTVNSVNWLRLQNEELQRKLDQHEPEINNAVDARAAAFKRLKHARKVIRDLLQERDDMHSPRQGMVTQADIDEVLFDNTDRDDHQTTTSSKSSSSSSSSEKTVRGANSTLSSTTETFATPRTSLTLSTLQVSPMTILPVRSAEPSPSIKSPDISTHPLSSEDTQLIRQQSANSTRSSPETLKIHFAKPPGSALVLVQFNWEELQQILHLGNDAWNSFRSPNPRSSGDFKDLRMEFEIMRSPSSRHILAFLYEPIFIENGKASYSISWGREETNEGLAKQINSFKAKDSIFHTFTSPSENVWYYIGAHEWSVVEFRRDVWPDDRKSRQKMVKKLWKNRREGVDEAAMSRLIDNRELKQFCVELTGVEDTRVPLDFAQNTLGKSAVLIESKRRRTRE